MGFLVWFGVDFILYGSWNISNLTATIVDPLLEIVRTGTGGAAIAAVLGKKRDSCTIVRNGFEKLTKRVRVE